MVENTSAASCFLELSSSCKWECLKVDFYCVVVFHQLTACLSLCLQAIDRRERLRRLALETIDLSKDPYFMRNHLGQYECRLCLTLHNNEGNYLAHTQACTQQLISNGEPIHFPSLVTRPCTLRRSPIIMLLRTALCLMRGSQHLCAGWAGKAASAEHGKACSAGGSGQASSAAAAEEGGCQEDSQDRAAGLQGHKTV